MDSVTALVARIGADPHDDEDLRQKKALLVVVTLIILPIALVWGVLYLGFGSAGGLLAFLYFAISLGSSWSSRERGASSPSCSRRSWTSS